MKILLIRHAATDFNKTGVFMGRQFDLMPLPNELNRLRETWAKFSSSLQFHEEAVKFFSSPMSRCRVSMQAVIHEMDLEATIELDDGFNETDYGEISGKKAEQIRSEDPKFLDNLMFYPSRIRFPNGESFSEVQARAFSRISALSGEYYKDFDYLMICTHVDVIKLLVMRILDFSIDQKRYFSIANGSVTGLDYLQNGKYRVEFTNFV